MTVLKNNYKRINSWSENIFLQTFRSIDKFITQKSPTYACVYGLTLLPNQALVHSMKIDQVTVLILIFIVFQTAIYDLLMETCTKD